MTDIVDRLESPLSGINRQWVLEAAAEIKQLTTERDRWQRDALGWSDRLTEATAEIEWLNRMNSDQSRELDWLRAEVKRLCGLT